MARTPKKDAEKEKAEELLKARREAFCRYYAQNDETFGNGTTSYAEAFEFKLDELSREAIYEQVLDEETGEYERGDLIEASEYNKAYHVRSVQASKLLRNTDIQERVTVLLNELLKDDIVDAELVKVIKQGHDLAPKVRAISEYNKLRGRIIDKSQTMYRLPFGETDISLVIDTLPQERQDYYYGIIAELVKEADAQRGARPTESGSAGEA